MACGCGSKVCNCAVVAGANVTVTGVGSSGNPYVISSSAGGGGGTVVVTTTIAGINALATGAALVPGTLYKVTDWVSGTGSLPGPNILWVEADNASTPSKFVRVETPLGILGPSDGEFVWNYLGSLNIMTRLTDNLGNEVHDLGGTNIDSFVWGNIAWGGNRILQGGFASPYADNLAAATAGLAFSNNEILGLVSLNLTGCTGGSIAGNTVDPGSHLTFTTGAALATLSATQVQSGASLTVPTGAQVTNCQFSTGCTVNVGAFTHSGVIIDGAFTVTLTAAKTNILINANGSNQLGSVVPWSTLARPEVTASNVATGTQQLRLNYFTATKNGSSTGVRMYSGGTAAAATPTLVQVGLYSIDAAGNGTLIASTPNDTTLLATTFTSYTKNWSVAPALQVGERYALGLLVVTAVAAPTMLGYAAFTVFQAENGTAPALSTQLTGQATLPASFTVGSLVQSANTAYMAAF